MVDLVAWLSICVSLVSGFTIEDLQNEDLYKLLELSESATGSQIKSTYRKLALKHHPDSGGDKDHFRKIQAASDILSDETLRSIYDEDGLDGVVEYQTMRASGGHQGGVTMEDILNQFFGGGRRQERRDDGEPDKEPLEVFMRMPLYVTLEDLYKGRTWTVVSDHVGRCEKCRGSGAVSRSDIHKCPVCKGQGVVTRLMQLGPGMYTQTQSQCDRCKGTGKSIGKHCPACGGTKIMQHAHSHASIRVSPGMADGDVLQVKGTADFAPGRRKPSPVEELYLVQLPHPTFRREGRDLHTSISINLVESLAGFVRSLTHLDGTSVAIDRSGQITPPRFVMELVGQGMPCKIDDSATCRTGSLYITFNVVFPSVLSENQKSVVRDVLAMSG